MARRGRPKLTEEIKGHRRNVIRDLRRKGLTTIQIGRVLNLRPSTLTQIIGEMISSGDIKPLKRGRKRGRPINDPHRENHEGQIIALRNAGFISREISIALTIPEKNLSSIISRMRCSGRLETITRGRRVMTATEYHFRYDRRDNFIADMYWNYCTLEEIGYVFDLTRERIRQIFKVIRKRRGDKYLYRDGRFSTVTDAAEKLGIAACRIHKAISSKIIDPDRRSGGFSLTREHIEILRKRLVLGEKKNCKICDNVFFTTYSKKIYCSTNCTDVSRLNNRKNYPRSSPTVSSLTKWRIALLTEINKSKTLNNDGWVVWHVAMQISGLSLMQLQWLKIRNIITTKPHPEKKWRGKPQRLFSVSQMKLVRKTVEDFRNSQER